MAKAKTVARTAYSYTVVFEPADEGGYTVTCPALPGLVSEGDTLDEARLMAADAIRLSISKVSVTTARPSHLAKPIPERCCASGSL